MPYSTHYLLQYGGTLGTQGEIWSNNIRFKSKADADAEPNEQSQMTGYLAALKTLFANSASGITPACKLTYLKFNQVGPDGLYVSNTESNTMFLTGADITAGVSTAAQSPFSVSMCVTWGTAFQRGRASKGRIFPPPPGIQIDAEGRIPQSTVTGMVTAYKTLLNSFNAVNPLPGDALKASVCSGINGAVNKITSVSIGNVPDTMRSRRNQLVEARTLQTVS